jgi:Ca2+:H+ antiporter
VRRLLSARNLLLLGIPAALIARLAGGSPVAVFVLSCAGIIPLAGLMGEATEELAKHLGQRIGGLLNATFGNATELIIAGFALANGYEEVVKASLTGSIIGNLLLVLGLAMLCGGWSRVKQEFSRENAGVNASMMVLAIGSLMIPAVFGQAHGGMTEPAMQSLTVVLALVLVATYLLGLLFTLRTHRVLFGEAVESDETPLWSKPRAMGVLGLSTAGVAALSECLVGAMEPATESLGLSTMFVGVIVIPIIGNAAEHSAAVASAMRNKMDISLSIAMGSSTQVALFVAPALVFLGLLIGRPLDFVFEVPELVAVGLSVTIVNLLVQDGQTHWFEGAGLLAMYLLLGAGFYFVPG